MEIRLVYNNISYQAGYIIEAKILNNGVCTITFLTINNRLKVFSDFMDGLSCMKILKKCDFKSLNLKEDIFSKKLLVA